mgnify:CR=1 FL=1
MRVTTRPAPGAIEHPVTPPPALAAWALAAALALPAIGLALALATGVLPPGDGSDGLPNGTWTIPLLLIVVAVLLAWAFRRRRVALDGEALTVTAALFHRRVMREAIDLARARIVDLAEHTGLRPRWKAFGMGLPGYRAGWYFLAGRARGFCLLTDTRRVLWLPLHDGGALLLSLERPQALLDALRGPAR